MRRTSINQAPHGGTNYPFVAPCTLTASVLDYYLSYPANDCAYVYPYTLTVTATNVTVQDANAVVIFDGVLADAVTQVWGTRLVYQWENATSVMRLVAEDLATGDGVLDPRTCNRLPARVTRLRIGLTDLTSNIVLSAGNNIELSGSVQTQTDGQRFRSTININAVPGAGRGVADGCDESAPVLRKINKVGPDCGGNFVIEIDDCFRVQQPLAVSGAAGSPRAATPTTDGLELKSDCRPCCPCDAYVYTYRGLHRVWDRWQETAVNAESTRDTYEENRLRWLQAKECREANPGRLLARTDELCKTMIGASYCNTTTCCLTNIEMRFTLQRYDNGVLVPWTGGSVTLAYISGSGFDGEQEYVPEVSGAVVRFYFPYADPGAISIAKMRFCTSGCLDTESLKITVTVHVAQPPPNPDTGDLCTLATIEDISQEILDVWALNAISLETSAAVRVLLSRTAALNPNSSLFACGC
jgi:hypothetical protein